MNMKELLLVTVVIAGLFSSAYANDREVLGDVAIGVPGGDFCNLTINMEAVAKYLNDELEKRTITASVLAGYIKAAAEAVDIASKTTSTARKCWACMQAA